VVGKKGYMKTLEAVIAVIVVLMVVVISLSFKTSEVDEVPSEIEALQDSIFSSLQNENRSLLFSHQGDIPIFLEEEIDGLRFEYEYLVCDDSNCADEVEPALPQENVYVDSFIVQGYDSANNQFDFKLFRLYIWYGEL